MHWYLLVIGKHYNWQQLVRSDVYSKINRGPRTDPWDILDKIHWFVKVLLFITTCWYLLRKYFIINSIEVWSKLKYLHLATSNLWVMVSKALAKSKRTKAATNPLSQSRKILSLTFSRAKNLTALVEVNCKSPSPQNYLFGCKLFF